MRLLGKALTFDDVLLVPAYSQVLPKDASLATRFSRNIRLNLPLVSAAMDTVTEARLAIAIAQEGGIGIVHKNLTAQEQAAHVAKVKRYESGVVRDPVVITPEHTVLQVLQLSEQLGISGFPVCDGGSGGGASMKQYEDAGFVPLDGYQLRYIYFIDKEYRNKLTVPELPYSEIDRIGAGMYKGEKRNHADVG